jgi:D-xylose transport system ATP-binding protein
VQRALHEYVVSPYVRAFPTEVVSWVTTVWGYVMAEPPPALAVHGVTKRFGGVTALSDVDLVVRRGEVVALVGENGAGKSTLVNILSGIYEPDVGTIDRDGARVRIASPSRAQVLGIATVFQDLALCENLDVVRNLLLRQLSSTVTQPRVKVRELSGGQRQTVAIARTLLGNPTIVTLDEPTAALGTTQRVEVLNQIAKLKARGLGVIMISHNLEDVGAVADRVVVLRQGRTNGDFAVASATTEQVHVAMTGSIRGMTVGGEIVGRHRARESGDRWPRGSTSGVAGDPPGARRGGRRTGRPARRGDRALPRGPRRDRPSRCSSKIVLSCRTVLGERHPDTLVAEGNLAVAYVRAGHVDGLATLDEEYRVRALELGPDDPRALSAQEALATAHRLREGTDEAIRLGEEVVAARERVLGTAHVDTLVSRLGLGLSCAQARAVPQALTILSAALEDAEAAHGPLHRHTIELRAALACCRVLNGELRVAAAEYDRAIVDATESLGADHTDTVALRESARSSTLRGEGVQAVS